MTQIQDSKERDPQTYAIIGAAMEVHRELGSGYLEAVYQEALAIEMRDQGIPFQREVALELAYKGRRLATSYRSDFLCFQRVIVETKAIQGLTTTDEAQLINYLKGTGFEVGLLLNFGSTSLQHRRLIYSSAKSA